MILPTQIPAIWVYTTLNSFNSPRAEGYPDFLTDDQKARVERIRQARLLFDGRHRTYFLDEGRTQFDFPPSLTGTQTIQPYLTYPLMGLIARKGVDLLFSEAPLLRVPDEAQQESLSALSERSNLHAVFSGAALDCSYEAEAFLESCIYNAQVYVQSVPADDIFPVGSLGPDGQYSQYVRYSLKNIGTQGSPLVLLLEITYSPGLIERKLFQLTPQGKKSHQVDLQKWLSPESAMPASPMAGLGLGGSIGNYSGPIGVGAAATLSQREATDYYDPFSLEETTNTGIDRCTITWVPNQLMRGRPVSDFDGAIDLQDALNAKQTQLARVIQIHANPKLALPRELFDDEGNFRQGLEAIPFSDPNLIPKYITWAGGGDIKAAQEDRDFFRDSLLTVTETSPVLVGMATGAHNTAFKTVRVQAQTSLKKAARKAVFWKAAIQRVVGIAQDLENTLPGVRFDRGPIGITMNDGIPLDDLDNANRISILRACDSMSQERSVEEQLGSDPAAVEAEMERLKEETAAKTPSIFLGKPGAGDQEATTDASDQPQYENAKAADSETHDLEEVAA